MSDIKTEARDAIEVLQAEGYEHLGHAVAAVLALLESVEQERDAALMSTLQATERTFPIMGRVGATWNHPIPWSAIAPHEAQALQNHNQSLETLARRGGLAPCEAVAVMEDRPWKRMDFDAADRRLRELASAAQLQQDPS